jgi:hypothetical protein
MFPKCSFASRQCRLTCCYVWHCRGKFGRQTHPYALLEGYEASSLHFMGVAIFLLFSHKSSQYRTLFFSFGQRGVQQKEAYFTCFFLQTLNTCHYKPKRPQQTCSHHVYETIFWLLKISHSKKTFNKTLIL